MVPGAGFEPARSNASRDFKSLASTNSAIPAPGPRRILRDRAGNTDKKTGRAGGRGGGGTRTRTGDNGFADRRLSLLAMPPRREGSMLHPQGDVNPADAEPEDACPRRRSLGTGPAASSPNEGGERPQVFPSKKNGAGNETRTRDNYLGKVALYQLSYARSEGYAEIMKDDRNVKWIFEARSGPGRAGKSLQRRPRFAAHSR